MPRYLNQTDNTHAFLLMCSSIRYAREWIQSLLIAGLSIFKHIFTIQFSAFPKNELFLEVVYLLAIWHFFVILVVNYKVTFIL